MMRRWLVAVGLLLSLAIPVMAQDVPPEKGDDDPAAKLDDFLDTRNSAPIQVYYTKAFFQEPWREDGQKELATDTVYLLVVDAALVALYMLRRRSA